MIKKQDDNKIYRHEMTPFRRYLSITSTIVIGIVLSLILFAVVSNWEREKQRIEFESLSQGYALTIQSSIHDYVEGLNYLGAFFNNSEHVTRKEFSYFAMNSISRHPGIQAFGWNPLILNSEREYYESLAKEDGFENFMFTERTENMELVRAAQRDEYVVVYYMEPLDGNEAAFGYDIASNPVRLTAIKQAFDSGNMSATERLTLVQEAGEQFGVLLMLPLYERNVPLMTVEDRQKHRKGFVVEVLRIGEAIELALKDIPDKGIDIYLYDVSADENKQFLYFRPSRSPEMTKLPLEKEVIKKGLYWSGNVDFGDRQWQLLFSPSSSYFHSQQSAQPWVVLSGSLLMTCLLAFYLSRKSKYSEAIEKQLHKNEQILETTMDGFILADTTGTIIEVNSSYCRMSGYTQEELLNMNIQDIEGTLSSEEIDQRIRKMVELGSDRFETRHKRKDGNIIDLDVSVVIMKAEEPPLLAAFVRDITAHKLIEHKIRNERDRAQKYLDIAGVMIATLDAEGSITLMNQRGSEMLGYREEDIIGKNWFGNFLPERLKKEVYQVFLQIMAGDLTPVEYYENPVLIQGGEERIVAFHNTVIKNPSGDITGVLFSGEDITERKNAEITVLDEKKFTETAIDAQLDTFFLFEPDTGKAVRWNKRFRDTSGYSDEEISALRAPDSYYSQEDLEKTKSTINDVMTRGTGKAELSLICKDGRRIPFEYLVSVIRGSNNKIQYLVSIGRDITERRNAEKDLIKSETKFRSVVESSPMGMHMYQLKSDNSLVFTGYNHAADQILGLDNSQFIGKNIEDAFPSLTATEVPAHYRQAAEQGDPWITEQITYKDEKISGAFQVHAFQTEPRKMVAMFMDVTEKKKAEETLLISRKHYKTLFDNTPVPIWEEDVTELVTYLQEIKSRGISDFRSYIEQNPEELQICVQKIIIKDVNRAALALHKTNNKEELLNNLENVFTENTYEVFKEELIAIAEGRVGFESEAEVKTVTGEKRDVFLKLVIEKDHDKMYRALLAMMDITDIKIIEKKQERLNAELISKNKELEQVLYVTSHDLRSPLVNVEGYSRELDYSLKDLMTYIGDVDIPDGIKDKITPIIKEDIPESLHYIQISVSKMDMLLRGILSLSRLGRYEQTIAEIDMNAMMSDIVDSHRFRLNELDIKTDISNLPNCKGDISQIDQVFSNLIDNAIKYSDSERPGVIHISGYQDKNQSVYCIEDNGLGIAPDHMDKIFEIFYQLEPNRIKGEGMGLTIAHRIIEKHHGKIWVESELGRSSKFFVSLPS